MCSALKYLHNLAKEVLYGHTDAPDSEPAAEDEGGRARPGAGRKSLKGRQGQVQGKSTDFRLSGIILAHFDLRTDFGMFLQAVKV